VHLVRIFYSVTQAGILLPLAKMLAIVGER